MVVLGRATRSARFVDMYLPAFPEIVSHLGTSAAQVRKRCDVRRGLALGKLAIGPLSDRSAAVCP